jgi:hypothetical protein
MLLIGFSVHTTMMLWGIRSARIIDIRQRQCCMVLVVRVFALSADGGIICGLFGTDYDSNCNIYPTAYNICHLPHSLRMTLSLNLTFQQSVLTFVFELSKWEIRQ